MMKSLITTCILASLLLLCAGQAFAQTEFGIGPIVGVNFGTASVTPNLGLGVTQGGHTGLMIGAQAELGFAKMFYIVMEPLYCGKGFSATFQGGTATATASEIDIPVLFKVKFMKGIIRPYAFAGPEIGFVMSSTLSITGRADQDIKSQISSTDFAIDFGGGAEYNVTPKIGITLDVRYSVGVGNMANPPAAGTAVGGLGSTNITLSGFQVLAGVMFHVD